MSQPTLRPLQPDQNPKPTQTYVPPPICAKREMASEQHGLSGPREGVVERAPAIVYIAPRMPTPRTAADHDSSPPLRLLEQQDGAFKKKTTL